MSYRATGRDRSHEGCGEEWKGGDVVGLGLRLDDQLDPRAGHAQGWRQTRQVGEDGGYEGARRIRPFRIRTRSFALWRLSSHQTGNGEEGLRIAWPGEICMTSEEAKRTRHGKAIVLEANRHLSGEDRPC